MFNSSFANLSFMNHSGSWSRRMFVSQCDLIPFQLVCPPLDGVVVLMFIFVFNLLLINVVLVQDGRVSCSSVPRRCVVFV